MKNFVYITLFTVAVSLFYTGVGQVLPQLESRPPVEVRVGEQLSTEALIEAGVGVFEANCVQCHAIGGAPGRCPDLGGMGRTADDRARERGPGFTGLDYLVEALCDPGAHLVDGYANIMPPQGKLLSGGQMLAVSAFLQDQGGTVTVNLADVEAATAVLDRFNCVSGGAGAGGGGPVAAGGAAPAPVGSPEQAWTTFGCNGCHALDAPTRLLGPSLQGIGQRLSRAELYESLLDPDGTMATGDPAYPAGLMKGTLDGNGFYERMTPADYQALVAWLAGK